jgi:hypothetical protein
MMRRNPRVGRGLRRLAIASTVFNLGLGLYASADCWLKRGDLGPTGLTLLLAAFFWINWVVHDWLIRTMDRWEEERKIARLLGRRRHPGE